MRFEFISNNSPFLFDIFSYQMILNEMCCVRAGWIKTTFRIGERNNTK